MRRPVCAWAPHSFATGCGLRDVAVEEPLYDGMSYHQGSVWPLFTGWAALAQYRAGNALAGYQAAIENVDLTYAQDPGAVTELLSGTSLSRLDAARAISFRLKREAQSLVVSLVGGSGAEVRLAGASGDGTTLRLPLPAVEVSVPHRLPRRGARTAQMKVLREVTAAHALKLEVEGMAGTFATLHVRLNGAVALTAEGAELIKDELHMRFPVGTGYVTQAVTLRW